jgi:NTE family protein
LFSFTDMDARHNSDPPLPLTLALSGGGAKCAAQAGVLAVLEEAALPVGALVGISGGGLVALLYASGHSPQAIRDYIDNMSLLEVWELDPARKALFGEAKIRARLRQAVGRKTFADLRIPTTVITADMNTGREIHLSSGLVEDAMLATMAIPGLFPTVTWDGMRLGDGGVVNPMPVDVARALGPRVVAVDVLHHYDAEETAHIFEARGPLRYATEAGRRLGLTDILGAIYQGMRLMSNRMSAYNLQLYPPDVLIRPMVGKVGLFATDLAEFAFEMGQAEARAALPQLMALAYPPAPSLFASVRRRLFPAPASPARSRR